MLTGRAKAYSSSCPQAVSHRSTKWARRRVTSFQPKRVTNYATPPTDVAAFDSLVFIPTVSYRTMHILCVRFKRLKLKVRQ